MTRKRAKSIFSHLGGGWGWGGTIHRKRDFRFTIQNPFFLCRSLNGTEFSSIFCKREVNFRLILRGFFVKEEIRFENQGVLDEKGIRLFVSFLDYSGDGFRHPI
jgi:hypothetical protein